MGTVYKSAKNVRQMSTIAAYGKGVWKNSHASQPHKAMSPTLTSGRTRVVFTQLLRKYTKETKNKQQIQQVLATLE
ncbi:MAG: hypothetical protein LBF84_01155 [Holosporales bacterium]|nr:hypothetical protein [Holosporales bacterium]